MKQWQKKNNKVYLLLGSNMGNSRQQIAKAIKLIEKNIGIAKRYSSIYQTAAWGNTHQPDFFNQVIVIETNKQAEETMQLILTIEEKMGRVRTTKNAPRIIDIDILFFNKEIINHSTIIIPHPQIQNRRFVLIPLHELSPTFKHPIIKKTIHQLLRVCPDKLAVKKL